MSTRIDPIMLTIAETGAEAAGHLLYDLSSEELETIDGLWRPYLTWAEVEMEMRGVSKAVLPDSSGWDWQSKLRQAQTISAYHDWRFFGVAYKGYLQGAVVISTQPRACQAEIHRGELAVGIEFVAAAPWNLGAFMRSIKREPYLDLIGRTLLRVAIAYSRAAGCNGRLYLYSVPKAESYYRSKCGMIGLGMETYHGEPLRRFEMTEQQATTLLEE